VTPKFLPVLIPCHESEADGTQNGDPVRLVPYEAIDLLIENDGAFDRKYGGDVNQDAQKQLRCLFEIIDAVRGGKAQKLKNVALELAGITGKKDPELLLDKIQSDPISYFYKLINNGVGGAEFVLWRSGSRSVLNAGIFCDGGMLHALYVLMAFRIGIGLKGGSGSCVICDKTIDRLRGDRRKTCSAKCRKQASRMKARAPRSRSLTRRRRA
jgi:hypothetical protein